MDAFGIGNIVEACNRNHPKNIDDYFGEKGLLYCGKCHTPKQMEINVVGCPFSVVAIDCKCEKERKKKLEDEENEEKRLRLKKRFIDEALIPKKFTEASFDKYVVDNSNTEQFKKCKLYAENFDKMYKSNQGLLLYGNNGTGKTDLACCIANHVLNTIKPVYFLSLVRATQAPFSSSDTDYVLDKIRKSSLVIIDDFGAERRTDYAVEMVFNIIETRYESDKPMIVTSNTSLSEMMNCHDKDYRRIYDRVIEMCRPIEFSGNSYRMKKAANYFDEFDNMMKGNSNGN